MPLCLYCLTYYALYLNGDTMGIGKNRRKHHYRIRFEGELVCACIFKINGLSLSERASLLVLGAICLNFLYNKLLINVTNSLDKCLCF